VKLSDLLKGRPRQDKMQRYAQNQLASKFRDLFSSTNSVE